MWRARQPTASSSGANSGCTRMRAHHQQISRVRLAAHVSAKGAYVTRENLHGARVQQTSTGRLQATHEKEKKVAVCASARLVDRGYASPLTATLTFWKDRSLAAIVTCYRKCRRPLILSADATRGIIEGDLDADPMQWPANENSGGMLTDAKGLDDGEPSAEIRVRDNKSDGGEVGRVSTCAPFVVVSSFITRGKTKPQTSEKGFRRAGFSYRWVCGQSMVCSFS
jgi:hypothetical protein